MSDDNKAYTDITVEKITLWQDHTHSSNYRPTLRMLVYPDGKQVLELNVFGTVTIMPYAKAECGHE